MRFPSLSKQKPSRTAARRQKRGQLFETFEPRTLMSAAVLSASQSSYTGIETSGPFASSGFMPISGSSQQSFFQVFALLDFSPSVAPGSSIFPTAGNQINDISGISLRLNNHQGEGTSGFGAHPGSFSVYLLPDNTTPTSSLTFQASDVHGLNGQAGTSQATLLGSIPFTSGSIPVGNFTTQLTDFASDAAKQDLINLLNGHTEFRIAITPDTTTVAGDFEGHFGGLDPLLTLTVDQSVSQTTETIGFSAPTYSVNETAGAVNITISRTGSTADAASIQFSTSNGTASAGTNYTAQTGTINFAAGQSSATVTLPISNVFEQGGNKTVLLSLTNPLDTGNNTLALLGTSSAQLTIVDTHSTPADTVTLTQNSSDNSTIQRAGPRAGTNNTSFFNVAGSGAGASDSFGALDFNTPGAGHTFNAGGTISAINSISIGLVQGFPISSFNSSGPMAVYIVDDSTTDITNDGNSPLVFSVVDPEGLGGQLGGTHLLGTFNYDQNQPIDVFTQFQLNSYNQDTENMLVTDINTGSKFRVVVVPETSGVEGSFEGQFTFSGLFEAPELTLNVTKAAQVAFNAPTYSVNEADGTATVTVTRSTSTAGPITVNYSTSDGTAIAGTDYTATSGTLNFADGQTSASFTVPLTNVTGPAGTKTFNVTLSSPSASAILGAQAAAVVSITDNAGSSVLLGDVNNDGSVDFGDISGFEAALNAPDAATFAQQHPDLNYNAADVNQDGGVDFGDITAFENALNSFSSASAQASLKPALAPASSPSVNAADSISTPESQIASPSLTTVTVTDNAPTEQVTAPDYHLTGEVPQDKVISLDSPINSTI